jgi:hypothetical protein
MSGPWICRCERCLASRPWEAIGMEPPSPPKAIETRTSNRPNYKGVKS